MLFKIIVILVMLATVYCLASGLFYLVKDKTGSKRTAKALTARVGLAVLLIILLVIGHYSGLIQPHPLGQ